jgi:D-beta-D-heptose 7-phosphate kinase/D-beta-D-heptose 1-phosphate adenosyltransferase
MSSTRSITEKIHSIEELFSICTEWKQQGFSVVFTNGCFDILHRGHLQILTEAASLGDKLIVALNTDASVKRLKGDQRPVNDEEFRSFMMASLEMVDAVILFDDPTPEAIINRLTPDVLVKGGDYLAEQIVGATHVLKNGGKVCIVPIVSGYSTTGLIEKIQRL